MGYEANGLCSIPSELKNKAAFHRFFSHRVRAAKLLDVNQIRERSFSNQ